MLTTGEESLLLERLCSLEDLSSILKAFSKDKIPSPDGWTMEFFLHYFELVGEDMLGMVEESRRKGEVIKAVNATFLVLIPKTNKPTSFGDFRPISLCNLCYKIIAKLLANRLWYSVKRISRRTIRFSSGQTNPRHCAHDIGMSP